MIRAIEQLVRYFLRPGLPNDARGHSHVINLGSCSGASGHRMCPYTLFQNSAVILYADVAKRVQQPDPQRLQPGSDNEYLGWRVVLPLLQNGVSGERVVEGWELYISVHPQDKLELDGRVS